MHGNLEQALSLLYTHDTTHSSMPIQTYATLFQDCAKRKCLQHGMALHHYVFDKHPRAQNNLFLTNHIIDMYCKCGHLEYAHHVFDKMLHRDVVSWTALISGYAQSGLVRECFSLFSSLLASFCRPSEFTFPCLLSACEELDVKCGMQVHAVALKIAVDASVYVANALITMYSRCSAFGGCYDHTVDIADCYMLFRETSQKDIVSWTTIMNVFAERDPEQAFLLFCQLHRENFVPNWHTFSTALKACAYFV
ncbi:hypothetical protein PIB30_084968 [Stylosanthes scabra]|uniref:Pentatricopeptide repeat-containing protein n=1 Tax=Stylosanthes scabra TaxID=79078 RepID=A0ABU6RTW5_9FABA|nr:hypothetical protein [Stylosanthes scabra]